MLDYLYSFNDQLDITDENATALHHLGHVFDIFSLWSKAQDFLEVQINEYKFVGQEFATFYKHARILNNDIILDLLAEYCVDHLNIFFDADSPLIQESDVNLWRNIIQHLPYIIDDEEFKHLSCLITKFCVTHQSCLDAETFAYLTDAAHMEAIDEEAAFPLLQLEAKFFPGSIRSETPTCLQGRCVDALVELVGARNFVDAPALRYIFLGLNRNLYDLAVSRAEVADDEE